MNIKNIEVFQSEPITIKTKEEAITVEKVPALATLKLYQSEDLVSSLLSLSTEEETAKAAKAIAGIFEKHYIQIIDIVALTVRKPREWVEENLGYNEILQIILAILQTTTEESAELVKKNSR